MNIKTLEQVALIIAIIALAWWYIKGGHNVAYNTNTGAAVTANNGLPYFLTYNVPSGFTGMTTPIEAVPSGTTGTVQPAPCVTCSLFGSLAPNAAQF